MEGYKVALLVGLFLCAITCSAKDVSVECMMAYEEGGAPAVFRSSNCPQWVFPTKSSSQNQLEKCESATLQGWRDYQEDRMACNPAMKIPFLGKGGQKDVEISVAGVFDGHGGKEASELASKKFLDYFSLHVVFINYKRAFHHKITSENSDSIEPSDDASFYAILEEALRRTFEDIDLEFSQEALRRGYHDGSTGTVVLMVNGKVLVGYVGDSKAILYQHQVDDSEGNLVGSCADELTIDHHPDREDEKARIEAAGGFVRVWGVPRVNGILAMSRSIGDIPLKRYGVIAEPEISWWNLTSQNSYLIVGSDGIFESLTPTDICEILHQTSTRDSSSNLYSISAALSSSSPTPSLAECIVNAAFKKGSTDNISVIVIPLEPQRS